MHPSLQEIVFQEKNCFMQAAEAMRPGSSLSGVSSPLLQRLLSAAAAPEVGLLSIFAHLSSL